MPSLTGLVIRTAEYGENEKILTVLTGSGKTEITVRGARGIKSKNVPVSALLSYSDFTVTEKNGRYTLKEGALVENFFGLRGDLPSFALASYAAQVADAVCMENNDESQMLSLMLNTLWLLGQKKLPLKQIKAAFELRTAELNGFAPDLSGCRECGKEDPEWSYLDVMNGQLICADCFGANTEAFAKEHELSGTAGILLPVERSVLSAMRYILYSPLKRFCLFRLDEEAAGELGRICQSYLLHHLGRSFDTLEFYREVEKLGGGEN